MLHKKIHHRVYPVEKQGKSCALTAQVNTQFYYEHLLGIGGVLFL